MADVVKKHTISSELAQKMVDQAVAKARKIGVAENVAILDDGGNLKAFSRMDGAPILSIEIAQNKAYTALFGVSTQDFFNFIQGDPSLLAGIPTLARVAAYGGGFPSRWTAKLSGRSGSAGHPQCRTTSIAREQPWRSYPTRCRLSKEGATMMIHSRPEMIHSHQTAPTQFVEANGIRFAYRRFGKSGGVPLVFNQHFTGTIDHWDPAVTDGLAATREVILFNNAGISTSSGEVPGSVEGMAVNAAAFITALRLGKVDVLRLALCGLVAHALSVADPGLVRRLVLVGTGPRGGEGMATLTPEAQAVFGATY